MDLSKQKKIIYAVAGLIVLVVGGFIAFQHFTPGKETGRGDEEEIRGGIRVPRELAPGSGEELVEEEEAASEKISKEALVKLSYVPVVSPSLDKSGTKVLFYEKDGGDLISSDFEGKTKEKISNITIVGLMEALWSRGERAAVFYLDGGVRKGFLFIGTSTVVALPQNVKSFSWSPDGRSLAYLIPSGSGLNLAIADAGAKNPRTAFATPIRDAGIRWVSSDRIVFETAASGFAEGFLFSFSRSSGAFTKILGPTFGLTSLWSSDGSRALVSATDSSGENLTLSVYDSSGTALFNTNLQTLPEKCAWSKNTEVFCAVPENPPLMAWPDDYLRGEVNTRDRIVRLDLEKKEVQEIFRGEFDISNLLMAGNYMVFVNRSDGALWSLKIR